MMKILIDADACPVINIVIDLCKQYKLQCLIFCDTAHKLQDQYAETIICDKGNDSVDYTLVNYACAGDIVITQDYGLASMCLAKLSKILHQDGWQYTNDNIEALLLQRHESRKFRQAGGRTKGPSKRKDIQNQHFKSILEELIQQSLQG